MLTERLVEANMIKKIFLVISLFFSLNAVCSTLEEANNFYANRYFDADGVKNARQASDIYIALSNQASDQVEKAKMLIEFAKSIYYVGLHTSGDDNKVPLFNSGKNGAEKAMALLEDADEDELLADATYQFGANLGKWGEARGNHYFSWPMAHLA